ACCGPRGRRQHSGGAARVRRHVRQGAVDERHLDRGVRLARQLLERHEPDLRRHDRRNPLYVRLSRRAKIVASCQLPVTSYQLPVASYQLPVASQLVTVHGNRGLGTGDRKLETGNWRLETGNWLVLTVRNKRVDRAVRRSS